MKSTVVACLLLFFTGPLQASESLAPCLCSPDFLSRQQTSTPIKNLPSQILIAQSANYFVESKSKDFQLWSEQSFVTGISRFVCGQSLDQRAKNFSLYGPTLLDLSKERKLSNSFWQFRMIANAKQYGIWNQKSRIFAKSKPFESALTLGGQNFAIFPLTDGRFEMQITRETESYFETLMIVFEAIHEL